MKCIVPYKQKYWQTLHLAVCSENAVGVILNWWFDYCIEKTHACIYNNGERRTFNLSIVKETRQIKITSAFTVCIFTMLIMFLSGFAQVELPLNVISYRLTQIETKFSV